ncbi:hypothetical protein [Niastella yeongjuensis]|nr:hypothetical protein [Niastella yeongjuensis]SEO39899.1 hypothetical protein SAMN05660816_02819 [Niastella yeongjuensis]
MFGFILSLLGCREHHFDKSDFVGVWQAVDGARITIKADGTCVLQGLNNSIVSMAKDTTEKLNADGSWKIINNVNNGITGGVSTGLEITYTLMNRDGKGGIEFYLSGQGFSENRPPWDLFIWKGDPDEMIKYKFVKQ